MQGFDSPPRLHSKRKRVVSSLVERFSDKEEADSSILSRPTQAMTENTDAQPSHPPQPGPEGVIAEIPMWQSVLTQMQDSVPEGFRSMFGVEIPPEDPNREGLRSGKPDVHLSTGDAILTFSRSNYYGDARLSHPPYSMVQIVYEPIDRRSKVIREALVVFTPNIHAPEGSVVYTSLRARTPVSLDFGQRDKGFGVAKNKFLRKIKNVCRNISG